MIFGEWLRQLFTGRAPGAEPAADEEGDADAGEAGDAIDASDPFPEPVRLEITGAIDLHAFAPRDVRRVVEAYLEEAHRAGFRSVRLIHGKGRYVQRAAVRAVLDRTPYVVFYADAPPEAGGLGATVAHLRTEDEKESVKAVDEE
jgi:hypothetical protein